MNTTPWFKQSLMSVIALALVVSLSGCEKDVVHQRSISELNQKAQALMSAGDYDGAIARLEAAHDLEPNEPNTLYNLAIAYQTKGDYDKAIAAFKDVQDKPGLDKAEINKALGISYEAKADQLNAQAKEAEEAAKPDKAKAQQLHQDADQAYHQALDYYQQAVGGLKNPAEVKAQIKALEDSFKKQEAGVPQ